MGASASCAAQATSPRDVEPVIVVGGGVMGRCTAWRLALAGERVVLLDETNPCRGSWGETRASHLAMSFSFSWVSCASFPPFPAMARRVVSSRCTLLSVCFSRRFSRCISTRRTSRSRSRVSKDAGIGASCSCSCAGIPGAGAGVLPTKDEERCRCRCCCCSPRGRGVLGILR